MNGAIMPKKNAIFLSIVIPAYNEANRIQATLEKISAFLAKAAYTAEVIVVDDSSTDDTHRIVQNAIGARQEFRLLQTARNRGKGGAVQLGIGEARGELVLMSDADLSTPIAHVDAMIPLLRSQANPAAPCDMVIGSRRLAGANIVIAQPRLRVWAGVIFSLFVRVFLFLPILDTQCGFKLFRRECIRKIIERQTIYDFGFDVEWLYLAKKYGFHVHEFPVTWSNSTDTKVRLLRDSLKMFADVVKIRWNDVTGRYSWKN